MSYGAAYPAGGSDRPRSAHAKPLGTCRAGLSDGLTRVLRSQSRRLEAVGTYVEERWGALTDREIGRLSVAIVSPSR